MCHEAGLSQGPGLSSCTTWSSTAISATWRIEDQMGVGAHGKALSHVSFIITCTHIKVTWPPSCSSIKAGPWGHLPLSLSTCSIHRFHSYPIEGCPATPPTIPPSPYTSTLSTRQSLLLLRVRQIVTYILIVTSTIVRLLEEVKVILDQVSYWV